MILQPDNDIIFNLSYVHPSHQPFYGAGADEPHDVERPIESSAWRQFLPGVFKILKNHKAPPDAVKLLYTHMVRFIWGPVDVLTRQSLVTVITVT